MHLPRFGDILIWINRSKTHRTIRSKVFHIWHSDPYMDRLRPSREYAYCVFPMEGQNEKLHVLTGKELLIDKEGHIDLHNIE